MQTAPGTPLTRRQSAIVFALSVLLVVAAFFSRSVLSLSILRFAVIGAAAPVVALLVFSYPRESFYFTVFYIYAGLNYYTGYPLAAPLVMLITLAVLFRILRGDETPVDDPFFVGAICLFVVLVITSMVYAWYPFAAIKAFTKVVKVLVVVFVCIQLVRTHKDFERFAMTIFLGVVATVVLGLVNMKMGWERNTTVLIGVLDFNRFAGTHINPNTGALYMVAGIPLAVYWITRAGRLYSRLLLGLVAIGLVVATIMTFSRQAIFSLAFVLLAVAFREARNKWGYMTVSLVVGLTFLLVPPYYWYRLSSISKMAQGMSEDWSFLLRLQAHKTAWHLFIDSPFTGVGLNNFIQRSANELFRRIPVHDAYMDVLSWLGIFGFLAFLSVLASGIRGFVIAARARWSDDLKWMSRLSYYFLVSFVAVLIGAAFQSVALYYLLWLPVAGGVVARRLAVEQSQPRETARIQET